MSMQVVTFNARIVLRPAVHAMIKRRHKEAVRFIVTRGTPVEESHGGSYSSFQTLTQVTEQRSKEYENELTPPNEGRLWQS